MRLLKKCGVITLVFSGLMLTGSLTEASAKVVVIVNKSNPKSGIEKSVLKRIYLGKQTKWDNGEKVSRFDLPKDNKKRQEFSTFFLEKSVQDMESHWISEAVIGGKAAPEIVGSTQLVIEKVAGDPGAIGYIDEADLDGSVKQVSIME